MYIKIDGYDEHTKTYKVSFGNSESEKVFFMTFTELNILKEYLYDIKETLPYQNKTNLNLIYTVKP